MDATADGFDISPGYQLVPGVCHLTIGPYFPVELIARRENVASSTDEREGRRGGEGERERLRMVRVGFANDQTGTLTCVGYRF